MKVFVYRKVPFNATINGHNLCVIEGQVTITPRATQPPIAD